MPAVTPVQNLIDVCTSLLRQSGTQSTKLYDSAQLLMYASQAAREVQRQLKLVNKQFFYDTVTFDMTDGQDQYDLMALSTDTFRHLIRVRRVDQAKPFTVRKIQGGWPIFERYQNAYPNPSIDPRLQVAMLNGHTLWIAPTPSQTVTDAFEALIEKLIVPRGGFTDAATDDLDPMPDEWVDFGGWWMAYLATHRDEESGGMFKEAALTMLKSLRADYNHEFYAEPKVTYPMDDDTGGSYGWL